MLKHPIEKFPSPYEGEYETCGMQILEAIMVALLLILLATGIAIGFFTKEQLNQFL